MAEILRALIVMSVSGSILAILLFALRPLFKNRLPKAAGYYLWLVVIAALLTPVSRFVTLPANAAPIPSIYDTVDRMIVTNEEIGEMVKRYETVGDEGYIGIPAENQAIVNELVPDPRYVELWDWCYIVWIIGAFVTAAYFLRAYSHFVEKLKRTNVPSGIDCAVPVYRNVKAVTPMLIGLFNPVIVLPDQEYTEEQLRSVLLHETTHLRRKDVLVKWLSVLACAVHWFNPIVWLARREIDRACELSCDEAVIRGLDISGKQIYGDTLICVAADSKTPRAVLSTTMCEEKKNLKERLVAIMENKKHTRAAVVVSVAVIAVAVIAACALGAGSSFSTSFSLPQSNEVSFIMMEQVNGGESVFGDVYFDLDTNIAVILTQLNGAKKTSKQSVDDIPSATDNNNYLEIRITMSDGITMRRLFLYSRDEKYFIEEPYVGIYETTREASEAFYKMLNSGETSDTIASLPIQNPGMYFGVNNSPINPEYSVISAQLMRLGDAEVSVGAYFTLEHQNGNEWENVPIDLSFDDALWTLDKGESFDYSFTSKNVKLSEGKYRFVVSHVFSDDKEYIVYAEFAIDKNAPLPKTVTLPSDWLGNLNGEKMNLENIRATAKLFATMGRNMAIDDLTGFKSINLSSDTNAYLMYYPSDSGFMLAARADETRLISSMTIRRSSDGVTVNVVEEYENIDVFLDGSYTPSVTDNPLLNASADSTDIETAVSQTIIAVNASGSRNSGYQTEAHVTLKTAQDGDTTTVYAYALSLSYVFSNGRLIEDGGSSMPVAITFNKDASGAYSLVEYWTPKDGSYYMPSIQERFPKDLWDKVDTQLYVGDCSLAALRSAQRHFGLADATKPEVTILKPLEVPRGTKPDWSEYFSITDDIDGAIPFSEAHIFDAAVENNNPGKYNAQLIVRDKAGNENRASYEITVK